MLKLGTQTGSLVNHILSKSASKDPQIGDGATILSWSDRDPATVFFYDQKKKIVGIKEDNYKRIDNNGLSESQEYEYTSDPAGYMRYYKKNKNGGWDRVVLNSGTNRWIKSGSDVIVIGRREKYHVFPF